MQIRFNLIGFKHTQRKSEVGTSQLVKSGAGAASRAFIPKIWSPRRGSFFAGKSEICLLIRTDKSKYTKTTQQVWMIMLCCVIQRSIVFIL